VTEPTLTQVLGILTAETDQKSIPATVLERAKVSLLHNLAVGLAGRRRETVAHVATQRFWAQPAEATLLYNGARVSVEGAALANGALINVRSQDDTHAGSTSHPGSPTMAAALAVAEAGGNTGAEFLAAIILGYEVLCRIGRDFDDSVTARGFRSAAILGGFGAAAATARLMRLSATQTTHAFGLQANFAGGLTQVWREGSAEAPFQIGFGARTGIASARVASVGGAAALGALDGEAGLYATFAGTRAKPVEALAGIGTHWQFVEVTVKPLPVCAILQGPALLFLDLLRQHQIAPDNLAEITLALSPFEADFPGIDFAGPYASAIATKLSAQFSLGLAAVDGRITPEGLSRVDDPAVLAISRLVRVDRDATIPNRLCRLSIRLRDGTSYAGTVDVAAGQPSFAACAAFVRTLGPEIGAELPALDRLIAAVEGLQAAPDIRELIAAAVACGGPG
jgi:2-methylcitrate dehydratase PrpD